MLRSIKYFWGFLLGFLAYSGIIQYTDQGFIDWGQLFFNPRPWFIALFVAVGIFVWQWIREKWETEDVSNDNHYI